MKFQIVMDWLAPFFALALVVGAFSLLPTTEGQPVRDFFLTGDNARFIAAQGIVIALGTLGMALVLLSGGIDLSAGASAALAGVVAATLLATGHSVSTALLAALLSGGLIGWLNGTLITALGIAPFIVTLGMSGVARGAASWLGVVLLLAGVLTLVLRGTVFGRHLCAIGSNEAAATLCGVRVRLTKTLVYALAGLFFGLAGAAQMAVARQGNPAGSPGLELDLIAAAVIGGVRLGGGSGHILGALLGALTITVLRNGCQQAGWPVPVQEMALGFAIIAVVGLDHWRRRGREPR